VEQNLDWKAIKAFLRIDENRLYELEDNNTMCIFVWLLVNYQTVKNVINARLVRLSRKNSSDKESVKKLAEELKNENNYKLLFKNHGSGAAFILAWVASWQVNYLEVAEEWCIDRTHKTSKSIHDPKRDDYLYTVVVLSPVTNRGVPVCQFMTDY
ncbi:hypothetical protein K501DRAFT_193741, partial [Backusella circina FSU 941]